MDPGISSFQQILMNMLARRSTVGLHVTLGLGNMFITSGRVFVKRNEEDRDMPMEELRHVQCRRQPLTGPAVSNEEIDKGGCKYSGQMWT